VVINRAGGGRNCHLGKSQFALTQYGATVAPADTRPHMVTIFLKSPFYINHLLRKSARLGLDKQVLDPILRTAEFGNWLRAKVLPRRAQRLAAA
jgi:hypothetical protein